MDAKGKQNMVRIVKKEQDFESDVDDDEYEGKDDDEFEREFDDRSFQKRKSLNLGGGGGGGGPRGCRVDNCTADLGDARPYHKRHKVCEYHAKARVVLLDGIRQRFCQQCSRFHELLEFDEAKRSCRSRLAGHNERRRKSSAESQGESSSHEEAEPGSQCGHMNDRGRVMLTSKENSPYKHFKIR